MRPHLSQPQKLTTGRLELKKKKKKDLVVAHPRFHQEQSVFHTESVQSARGLLNGEAPGNTNMRMEIFTCPQCTVLL